MRTIQDWKGELVLASGSPRRRELLAQIGLTPRVMVSGCEETSKETQPDKLVMELSLEKARDVAEKCPAGALVIGADTVVAVDGTILGKPGTPERAAQMIRTIAGRTHQVYTGVTLIAVCADQRLVTRTFAECTNVQVYAMSEEEILDYANCGEPLDKAGAYGIQGRFAAHIRGIEGDYSNVVGLPLGRLCQECKAMMEEVQ